MKTLTEEQKKKLINLKFKYINELKHGSEVYEVCKPDVDAGTKGEIVGDSICFWDNSGYDHRCCIPLRDILIL
jgi:hypothetical protein